MINKELKLYKTLVDNKLKDVFRGLKKEVDKREMPVVLFNAMHYSVFNGGKRIRPILCIATYNSMKNNCKLKIVNCKFDDVLPFACGIELVHTFSLIQDDLPSMDNDDFRRGKPSLHRKYGEAIALLAADALFATAFQLFSQAKISEKIKTRAIAELARVCGPTGLVGGQILDIMKSQQSIVRGQQVIDQKKTAELIAGSMKIGAIVAGARENKIKKINRAGISLGMLFQVTDDILDKTKGEKQEASRYAKQTKLTAKLLGNEFNWLSSFTDYIQERKQ